MVFHRHHRTAILGRGSVFRDNRVVTPDPGRLCGIFGICVHLNRGREGSNVFNQQSHRLSAGLLLRRNLPVLLAIFIIGGAASRDESAKPNATDARGGPLQFLNSVVGKWRGVGQPKRGSRQGAWQETTTCRWDFSGVQPIVRLDAESRDKRQFERLEFRSSKKGRQLELWQYQADQSPRVYYGSLPDKWPAKIRLETKPDNDGHSYRCTVEQLKNIRLVLLFERRTSAAGSFRRVAGIGYTRSGFKLAKGDGNQRECVVTGGQGTIAVQHNGKTWYVCCEGCRQVFEEAPNDIIEAYLGRND